MAHDLIIRSNLNPYRRPLILINLMEKEQIIKPDRYLLSTFRAIISRDFADNDRNRRIESERTKIKSLRYDYGNRYLMLL